MLRGAALNIFGGVAFGACSFLYALLLSRWLGAAGAAPTFLCVAAFWVALAISQAGTSVALSRFVPLASMGDRWTPREMYVAALVPVVVLSSALALAALAGADALAPLLTDSSHAAGLADQLRVFALGLPGAAITAVGLSLTRGDNRMAPTVWIDRVATPVARLLLLAAAIQLDAGAVAAAWAFVVPVPVAAVASVLTARRSLHVPGAQAWRVRRQAILGFWRFAGYRALGEVLQVSLVWFDVLLLGYLAVPAAVSSYAAASRYLYAGTMFVTAVSTVLQPRISPLLTLRRYDEAGDLFRSSTQWVVALAVPGYAALTWFAGPFMGLFGSTFRGGSTALVILCVAMTVSIVCGPVTVVLLMGGRSRTNLANAAAVFAVNVALNAVLTPAHGAVGAAVAWAVAIGVANALPLLQVWRAWGLHPFTEITLVLVGAAYGVFGIASLVSRSLGGSTVVVASSITAAAAVYGAILWARRRLFTGGALASAAEARAT